MKILSFLHLNKVLLEYEVEERIHHIKMYLRLPLFDDEYVVVGKDKYGRRISEVKGGKTSKSFQLSPSKHDSSKSKKKTNFTRS